MAHAKLSPSASHRWMNCPGSVALIGDESSPTNQAAMMGTAAHKVIETMIIAGEHDAREYAGYAVLVKAKGDEETELYPPGVPALPNGPREGWFMFMVDEKMVEGCQQTIDEVDRIREECCDGTEIFSEHFLDMSWLDNRLGGTADITIVEPFGWAYLVDHKNGYIIVEAKDNDQLKQYAVGILHEHPDCEGVTVTISQPNAPHMNGLIRSETFTRDELKLYEIRMKEAADATSAPNAPRRVGDWCTFCPAQLRCEEHIASLQEEAGIELMSEPDDFEMIPINSNADLARMGKWLPHIERTASMIKATIQTELENGNEVEGWKLVRGKSKRRWVDPVEVQRLLVEDVGIDDGDIWVDPKLKTPAQMEKLGIGREQRKAVKAAVGSLAFMPNGKLTIAEVSDPREAAAPESGAEDDFADDDEDFM